ncbi:MAG: LamG-like jellyroll fold domain-containing protein, partial [Candidatus Nanoarchaeia archaeon]
MAYKRYFYKNGKKLGPYYYESYRDKTGKVKKRYVGTLDPDKKQVTPTKKIFILLLIFGVFALLIGASFFYLEKQNQENKNSSFSGFFKKIIGFVTLEDDAPSSESEATSETGTASETTQETTSETTQETPSQETTEVVPEEIDSGEVTSEPAQTTDSTSETLQEETTPASETTQEETSESTEQTEASQENTTQETEEIAETEPEINQTQETNQTIEPEINQTISEINETQETGVNETISETDNSSELNQTTEGEETNQTTEIIIPLINESILNESFLNETLLNESLLNQTLLNETLLNETLLNETLLNQTLLNESELNISIIQYSAVINRPVKWIKTLNIENIGNLTNLSLEIPLEAQNITIKTDEEVSKALEDAKEFEKQVKELAKEEYRQEKDLEKSGRGITGQVFYDTSSKKGILTRFFEWLTHFTISGRVIDEQEVQENIIETEDNKIVDLGSIAESAKKEVAVEYYTPAPSAYEENFSLGKKVTVYSIGEMNYTNILAYSSLDNRISIEQNNIRVIWKNENKEINFSSYDLDSDGFIDYIEWNVEHLSNQTYEIIYITKAERLDENRVFIEDIYEQVKEKDDNWTIINNSQYVRVTFEIPLDNTRDITIYARGLNSNSTNESQTSEIEVYEQNSSELITTFENISEEVWYKVYLTNMSENETQETFDLRFIGDVEVDYIVDPTINFSVGVPGLGINYYTNGSVLNVSVLAYANSPKNVSSFIDFDHSLVSWWRMDDNLSGVLIDYMGYHNGSVLNNAVQNTSGRLGDSFSFDGVDDAINLTQGLSSKDYPSGNESRTIAYWFMAGGFATTAFNATFGFWDNASANGKIFQSGVEDNAVCLVMGGHRVITPKNALLVNTWYHVAIVVPEGASDTYDPLIYINGTNQVLSDEACSGCPHVLNTSIFTSLIGNIYSLGNDFNGSIDDVMVFNRSFSAEEIQALYAITSNRSFVGSYNLSLERNYTFEVYAQDSSGEVNTSGELNVLRDFGNPSVEINSPINLNYASGNINFNVTSSESGVGSIVPNLDSSLVSWWRMDDIASGSELVTEGDFSNNGAAWTSTSGWDFSAGNANSDGGDSLSQDLDIIAGVQYNVTYEIIDYTSGYAQVALGTMPAVTAASAVGVYSEIITPIDNSGISFNLNLGPDLTIDNVSVKRVNAGIVDYMGINNGTIVNETTLTDAGAFGKGIRFDGVNDYIVLGDTASLKVPTKTINFWANPTINSQCTASLCILFSSGNGQYYIGIRNNTDSSYYLYLAFVNSTGSQKAPASPAYSVKINEWHMYTVMFNVTGNIVNVSYYRDGVFIETDTFNEGHYASYGNNFVIGALSSNSAYDYNGSLDDISFFNRTLSSDEVFALYNATAIYHNRIIPDGSRSYTAYVQDKYGRVAEDSVSFNVDTSYPTQIINSPANTTYTSVNITFNATSSESSSGSLISDLNKSLVTWWRMDETNSSGDIIDYFGLNNASALGDSMQTDEGYFGKGFRFDGTGDYSVVGDKANLELVNGTISLWVYPVGYRDAGGFVSKSIGGGVGSMVWTAGFEYTASTPSGKPRFYLGNGTAILGLTMLSSIPLNTWSNMVFWWNGSYMSIYYNGVLNRTQAQTLQVNTTNTFPVEIGRQFAGANFLFNGTIDDIMIFNRPLTADEIVALYNATAIKHNKTLSEAGYNYTIYSQDRAGNLNSSSVSFGIESTSLTSPRELTQPNTVYVLQNDLTGLSDTVTVCFDVLADNITIDGNGKTINSGGYGLGYYGVQVNGRKNITIKNFKNISGFESGIYLYSSNDSVISNISSYSNYYGMDVSSNSNNNVFTNVNLNLNTYGVNLYSNTKNNFTNITSNSNSDYGVYLQDSTYNVFDNLTANSNSNNGIYLYNSSFNALKRIVANSNIYGMSAIFGSNNNTIMNLTTNLNSNYGTIISASRNNLINNLTSNSNLLYGVYINASLNNTIGNFSVWNSSAIGTYAGLYVYESSNNSFIRGNINLSSEYGIWVYSSGTGASDTSFSNRFYDVNIFNVLNYGVYLDTTSNSVNQYNNFTNMYIYNSTPHAVYLESLNHVNLFKNITINITTGAGINITLSLGNHIINNSFYNVNGTSYYLFNSTINEYSLRNNSLDIVNTLYGGIKFLNNSLYASGTNMSKSIWLSTNKVSVNSTLDNGFNTTANITIKGLSLTRPKAVVDYNSDGTFEECTVASGCNNLSYSSGVFVFNVTHFTDYRAGEYTEVLSCRELDLPNMTYVLNASAVTTGTCFTITADNITFDGQGNTVDGDDSGSDYGIYAQGRRNITIKNFKNITDFDTGIYFGNTNDSWIYNLSAQSGSIGLTLSYCFDVNVSDVSARLSGDKGIYIQESAYNRFTNVSSSSSTS